MTRRHLALIPNALSWLRLALALLFPFCPEAFWVWMILGSAASDFLDGWCARRLKVASWKGGLLDAVADKSFMLIALATFAMNGRWTVWWIPAILARDLTVAVAAAYTALIRSWVSFHSMGARWSGKLATAGQFFFLVTAAIVPSMIPMALWITVPCSIFAAGDYGLLFYQALRQRRTRS